MYSMKVSLDKTLTKLIIVSNSCFRDRLMITLFKTKSEQDQFLETRHMPAYSQCVLGFKSRP